MFITTIKNRLSHLEANSWHRKLVDFAFFGKLRPNKACPYWWFVVPSSLPLAGLKVIGFVAACIIGGLVVGVFASLMFILGHLAMVPSWFFGFRIKNYRKDVLKLGMFESHRRASDVFVRDNRKVVPWMVLLPAALITGIVVFVVNGPSWIPGVVALIGLSLLGLIVLGLLYAKLVHPLLHRLCPEISWQEAEA